MSRKINDGLTVEQRYQLRHPGIRKIISHRSYMKNRKEHLRITSLYKKTHKKQMLEYSRRYRRSAIRKYVHLKARSKSKKMPFLITREQFVNWFNDHKKVCHYCKIQIECCHENKRQWLSFDRKDNNLPYSLDNIVLCCYKCNSVKSNDVSYEAMIKIGRILEKEW